MSCIGPLKVNPNPNPNPNPVTRITAIEINSVIIQIQEMLQTYLCYYQEPRIVCMCSYDCKIQMQTAEDL